MHWMKSKLGALIPKVWYPHWNNFLFFKWACQTLYVVLLLWRYQQIHMMYFVAVCLQSLETLSESERHTQWIQCNILYNMHRGKSIQILFFWDILILMKHETYWQSWSWRESFVFYKFILLTSCIANLQFNSTSSSCSALLTAKPNLQTICQGTFYIHMYIHCNMHCNSVSLIFVFEYLIYM